MKLRQFALEARSLDAGRMQEMAPAKRYTLAATLIELQNARVLDDLTEMFIKTDDAYPSAWPRGPGP